MSWWHVIAAGALGFGLGVGFVVAVVMVRWARIQSGQRRDTEP